MKIEVVRSRRLLRQRWHNRLVASNGEILMSSEPYVRKIDAVTTAHKIAAGLDVYVSVVDE